jgi:hypothetical protein
MVILPRRVEHPLNVAVQGSHHAYPREHRRAVMFRNQQERRHRSLPFFGIVFCLRQFRDVERGVAQGDKLLALGQFDRLGKWTVPRHDLNDIVPATKSKAPDRSGAPLPAAGVHPANGYYSHLATYFSNKLRPGLG